MSQGRQTLGGDGATGVEVETQQADAVAGGVADAHSQGGPAGQGALHEGGAVA